jgi:hypothetical protein
MSSSTAAQRDPYKLGEDIDMVKTSTLLLTYCGRA